MQTKMKVAIGSALAGCFGYIAGTVTWEIRKTNSSVNKLVTLGNLYSDIAKWIGDEGIKLHPHDFERVLHEKLIFVALVAKATD